MRDWQPYQWIGFVLMCLGAFQATIGFYLLVAR